MRSFGAALWAETLKARRSLIMPLTVLAMSLLPMLGGLFMIILKDPESARDLGLISTKAQLAAGVADWASFFGILLQGSAIAGAIIFAFITSWVFGAEFSNRMNTRLLALPTRRLSIVVAKFSLIGLWTVGLGLLVYVEALLVGRLVVFPGWSEQLVMSAFWRLLTIIVLTSMLMPLVAFAASLGRGVLPPMGWALLTVAMAQIAAVLGWGDWIPWSVPALLSGAGGPNGAAVGAHGYFVVGLAFILGVVATALWWQYADQSA